MWKFLPYLVFLGAFIQLFGVVVYIRETLAGRTKPNRLTWLLWSIAPLIGTAAAVSAGAGLATLPVFMAGFGPLLIFLASFANRQAYWHLTPFDYGCGILSGLALLLWLVTNEPLVAIVLAIMADLLAAVPTINKAWHFPETENVSVYLTGLISTTTSFAASTHWNWVELSFPVYLCLICLILIMLIIRPRLKN